jgi:hypothetical protein
MGTVQYSTVQYAGTDSSLSSCKRSLSGYLTDLLLHGRSWSACRPNETAYTNTASQRHSTATAPAQSTATAQHIQRANPQGNNHDSSGVQMTLDWGPRAHNHSSALHYSTV